VGQPSSPKRPLLPGLLGESCPRLGCLKLSMLCRLDSLVCDSSATPPAFPALRCLDIAACYHWYVLLPFRTFEAQSERVGEKKMPQRYAIDCNE
jgi:hypothetical protein